LVTSSAVKHSLTIGTGLLLYSQCDFKMLYIYCHSQSNHVIIGNMSQASPLNPRKNSEAKPSDLSTTYDVTGVLLHHKDPRLPYTFAIAAKAKHKVD